MVRISATVSSYFIKFSHCAINVAILLLILRGLTKSESFRILIRLSDDCGGGGREHTVVFKVH